MKKLFAIFAVVGVLLAGCTKETAAPEEVQEPAGEGTEIPDENAGDTTPESYVFTLRAVADADITKTSYSEDKYFSWSAGDQISVLFHKGEDNKFFTLTTTSAGVSVSFSGAIDGGYEIGSSNSEKIALFPAGNHSYDRTRAGYDPGSYPKRGPYFNIPAVTDFTLSHASANLPMAAIGDGDNNFSFKHIAGTFKFAFTGIDPSITKVRLHVKNQVTRALSGDFRLEDGGSHNYVWWWTYAAEDSEAQSVTHIVNVADGRAEFYIPYTHNDADGFQPDLTLTNADNGYILKTLKAKVPFSGDLKPSYNHMVVVEVPASGTGDAPVAGLTSPLELSFTEASGEVPNPERGMMSYSKFNLDAAGPYTVKSIPNDYTGESLAFILFYLTYYMDKDLDANVLDLVRGELAKVRTAGKKAVLRFAYSETYTTGNPQEATPEQILRHVDQLADVFLDYADVIYTVQAGWLGTYGEWYYKTNNHDNSVPAYTDYYKYTVSGSSVTDFNSNHKNLLDRMLLRVPSPINIGLRTAFYKRYYLSPSSISSWTPITEWSATPGANERLAFFNDGIRGSDSDVGTFNSSADRDMWYSQGNWTVCGGEMSYRSADAFAALSDELKNCDLSIAEMRRQHLSYLHYSESNRFMVKWIGEGRMEDLKKMLGYRLVLDDAAFSFTDWNSGSTVNYSISVENKGCAPVVYPRPFKLVLLRGGSSIVLADNLGDIRTVAAGASATEFAGSFTLPQTVVAGDKLAIWLPDNADALRSNAAYSIRFANSDVTWESGYNVIYTF